MNAPPYELAATFQLTEMLRSELAVAVAEIRGSAKALDAMTRANAATAAKPMTLFTSSPLARTGSGARSFPLGQGRIAPTGAE
jgi:hypothetical protein